MWKVLCRFCEQLKSVLVSGGNTCWKRADALHSRNESSVLYGLAKEKTDLVLFMICVYILPGTLFGWLEHICTQWEIFVVHHQIFVEPDLVCDRECDRAPTRPFAVSRLYTYYILTHFSAPTEPLAVSTLFNLISIHSLICLRPQQNLAYKPGCWLEFLLAGLGEEGRAEELLVLLPQALFSSCPWGVYRR